MADDEAAEPRRPESTATVLARMEGVLNLVNFKVDGVLTRLTTVEDRVTKHDEEFESVRLTMQHLADEAKGRTAAEDAARIAAKAAVKEEREERERRWSPVARLVTGLSAAAAIVLAIVTVVQYLHVHG